MNEQTLSQSILETLAFFDLFDAGLTAEEVQSYLFRSPHFGQKEYTSTLDRLVASGDIVHDRGYYGLRPLADERIRRIPLVAKKMKRALRAGRILRYIPFIRAVFVCNNLAFEAVSEQSDIDVFIVTKPGRIWTARFFSTIVLRLLRVAITKGKTKDRVCLSFYATSDALDFASIQITHPDIYLMYWVRTLVPLFDRDQLFAKIQSQNAWVDAYLSRPAEPIFTSGFGVTDTLLSRRVRQVCEAWWSTPIGDMIERQVKEIQLTKMKFKWYSVKDEPDSRVVVNDQMLKFHENDRRVAYKEAWEENTRITDITDVQISQ